MLNCELNYGWHYLCVNVLRNMCYTCTDVSSVPHIVPLKSMYIVERSLSLCVYHYSLLHVLYSPNCKPPGELFFTCCTL